MRSDFSLKTKEDTDSCRVTICRMAFGAIAYYLRRIERRATASMKKVKNRKREKIYIIVYCYYPT